MAVTKVQQTQVSGTLVSRVSDSVSNANLLKANRTIEDDLNSLRTQVKLIMGTTAWTDNLSGSQDLADIYAGLRVNGATGVANFQNDVYAATNLFISGSSVIAGDLTVNGTTTTINTTNLEIKDAIIGLGFASGTIQQAAGDRGWIGGISGGQNVASFWDDSASEFVFVRTTNSATASLPITIASYANLRAAVITGSVINATSGFSGSLTRLTDGTSYLVAGSNVTITSGSNGSVTISAVSTATTPASPTNSVQYNNGGSFGGSANFTFNGSAAFLTGSFAQGGSSFAIGTNSHSEGFESEAQGDYSHAEAGVTFAVGSYSHSEGYATEAIGYAAHSEGFGTSAQGDYSHAEGEFTTTKGNYSHAAGTYTIASGSGQNVVGKYNKRDNTDSLFIVGNGSGATNARRDDIFLVNSGSVLIGSASLASDTFLYVGTKGAANTALFAGNVQVSGTLKATLGLSGSLTKLVDGTSYLIAGSGITITSASNGAVTVTNSSTGANVNKGYLLGNSAHINTGTGVITFGPAGANFGTLSTATDEYIDIYLNGVYLAYGYDVTTITTTTATLDSTITSTFTADDIISITLRNYT
jgi:hypothetical protein